MPKQKTCPSCGCLIANEGYETGGVVFCCEPCSKGEPCDCGGSTTPKKPRSSGRRKCVRKKK
jgi:hypothetical protein